MRNRVTAGLVTGAAVAALALAAPAAQASTARPQLLQASGIVTGATHPAAVRPLGGPPNCANGALDYSGSQWYYTVSCGVTAPTVWTANIYCSNGTLHSAGPYSTFENVQVYCPPGTTPATDPATGYAAWVSYVD